MAGLGVVGPPRRPLSAHSGREDRGTFPKTGEDEREAFISRVKGGRTNRKSGPWVSATTLVEKRTRVVEDVDPRKNPRPHSCLHPSTTPPSLPRATCFPARSPATDSCVTSGGAQCYCGQLIPRRWRWQRRRRPPCPRRRQGANRVPAGSRDARGADAALGRGPVRELAPTRTSQLPAAAAGLGRAATSSRAFGLARSFWAPQAWAGAQPPRARMGGGVASALSSVRTGHCPADSPHSLPAPPPPSWQPWLCARSRPDFGAGD